MNTTTDILPPLPIPEDDLSDAEPDLLALMNENLRQRDDLMRELCGPLSLKTDAASVERKAAIRERAGELGAEFGRLCRDAFTLQGGTQ